MGTTDLLHTRTHHNRATPLGRALMISVLAGMIAFALPLSPLYLAAYSVQFDSDATHGAHQPPRGLHTTPKNSDTSHHAYCLKCVFLVAGVPRTTEVSNTEPPLQKGYPLLYQAPYRSTPHAFRKEARAPPELQA
ncbi:MAG: hypothetical protein JSV66_08010 [Trueperaceae bacterium]|nr:MAG: hypothetical protein JSV66_08010 [Trueperaceae bacterium]